MTTFAALAAACSNSTTSVAPEPASGSGGSGGNAMTTTASSGTAGSSQGGAGAAGGSTSSGYCQLDGDCDDGESCTTDSCIDAICIRTSDSVCPWPAETAEEAVNLTDIEGPNFDNDFHANLSGAVYNPDSRTLWLVRNGPGMMWAVVEDGMGGYAIREQNGQRAKWEINGDIEAIAQADFGETNIVYVLDEASGSIREYDLSDHTVAQLNQTWSAPGILGGSGAEGMTFVPDSFLTAQGFVDGDGNAYQSTQGMGGLMLVGHQAAGHVYAFDLNRGNGEYVYVGRFETGATETAGLEFDRSQGVLYIWHDSSFDQLELTRLSSTANGAERKLTSLLTYSGPQLGVFMSDNLEGIAIAPLDSCSAGHRRFWMTTDGGQLWSLTMYTEFPC